MCSPTRSTCPQGRVAPEKYSAGSRPFVVLVAVGSAGLERIVSSATSRHSFVGSSSASCPLPRIPAVVLCLRTRQDAVAYVTMDIIAYRYFTRFVFLVHMKNASSYQLKGGITG